MVGDTSKDARWPAKILGFGNHDMPDIGRGLQAAAAPEPRVDVEYCEALEARDSGAGFFDLVASWTGANPSSETPGWENRAHSSGRGQYRPKDLRRRRVATQQA